ncbi:hypothetical protein M3Y99_01489200 [Aphelenchoides fujianensis]|nr:hypothetical protein M3Y99_01489200 [Aphelenchoides fujianensis]
MAAGFFALVFFCLLALLHAYPRYNEELEFVSSPSGYLISGIFERPTGHHNREFWLCVDFESAVRGDLGALSQKYKRHTSLRGALLQRSAFRQEPSMEHRFETLALNEYPIEKCGGLPKATQSPYWFALRGVWESSTVLALNFINTHEMLESKVVWNDEEPFEPFPFTFLIKHQAPGVDLAELLSLGRVHVPSPLSRDAVIHLRAHGDGIRLNSLSTEESSSACF